MRGYRAGHTAGPLLEGIRETPHASPRRGAFSLLVPCGYMHGYTVRNPVPLATWWLHGPEKKKPRYRLDSRVSFVYLGWLMGLEPTTTGITILSK